MANIRLSDESDNPAVSGGDYIYTEKGGNPPITYRTTVQQLQSYLDNSFVMSPGVSVDGHVPIFVGTSGNVIQNSGLITDINGNLTTANANVNGDLTVDVANLTGAAFLSANPTTPLQAATKQYVDSTLPLAQIEFPTLVAYRATDLVLTNGVTMNIPMSNIDLDNYNAYSMAFSRYTIPVTGWYHVNALAHVRVESTTASSEMNFQIVFSVTGNGFIQKSTVFNFHHLYGAPAAINDVYPLPLSCTAHFFAGVNVTITVFTNISTGLLFPLKYLGGSNESSFNIYPATFSGQLIF